MLYILRWFEYGLRRFFPDSEESFDEILWYVKSAKRSSRKELRFNDDDDDDYFSQNCNLCWIMEF